MTTRPLILLTNDDGFDSPGLIAAAAALTHLGELLIAAPLVQQSGMGRAWPAHSTGIIHRREIRVDGASFPAYAVDGSPAQVVAHTLLELAPRRPDLAVSGINYGQNLAVAVMSSGTVGAAMEAAISGLRSMAISLEVDKRFFHEPSDQVDFSAAAHFVGLFAERLLSLPRLPRDVDLLKIEVPRDATPETSWEMTRQSRRQYFVSVCVERTALDEPGRIDYTMDPSTSEPGTDTHTLAFGRRVSVTPLSLDLTSRTDLDALGHMLSNGCHPSSA